MRLNKKLTIAISLILSLTLISGLFVTGFAQEDGETYRIGLVFDVGGKGDKSFNDSAYRGLQWAKNGSDEFEEFESLPINFTTIEPGSGGAGREDAMRMMASQGFDLVIGVGYLFSDIARSLSESFPNVNFAIVDYSKGEGEVPSNLVGLSFPEQQGSFLVGALAAMKTETNKLGFVGGMSSPLIAKFEAGFKSGAWYVNPDLEISTQYVGTTGEAFVNPAKGNEIAKAMYNDNVDIIYHAAGLSGTGVINAAADTGNYAIGVDSDQNYIQPGHVLTSMLKRVDVSVYKTIRDVVNGEFEGGVDRQFGLAEDGLGYAIDVFNRVEEFPEQVEKLKTEGTVKLPALGETQISPKKIDQLPSENLVSDSMVERVEELKTQIVNGEFTVPDSPDDVTPEEPVLE
ncbi:BMP family ABC transporter substrate-binding protein [Candidatus Bipolaricaulota bacterium]|nr:BMP family ABC transporter substrate-binding protein [Candidatus Bipolaricaulota bacterium]